jgi:hypothetical protein
MLTSVVLAAVLSILVVFIAKAKPRLIQVAVTDHFMQGSMGPITVIAVDVGVLVGVVMIPIAMLCRSSSVIRHERELADLQQQMHVAPGEDVPEE